MPLSRLSTFLRLLLRLHRTHTPTAPPLFTISSPAAALINPRAHRITADSVGITIPAGALTSPLQTPSSAPLLTTLLTHFFTGPIFLPERLLLWCGLWRIFGKPAYPTIPAGEEVWSPTALTHPTTTAPPPVGTLLWGAFLVVDVAVDVPERDEKISGQGQDQGQGTTPQTRSYIDLTFGHPSTSFAGCHRIEVVRRGDGVDLHLHHFHTNPCADAPTWAERGPMPWFHGVYAEMLFADAVRGVVKDGGMGF